MADFFADVDTAPPMSKFQSGAPYADRFLQDAPGNPLWPHQREALAHVRDWFAVTNSRCVVVIPTGAGKSGVLVLAPYVLKARKCLVISPSPVITKQLLKEFLGTSKDPTASFFMKRGIPQVKFESVIKPADLEINRQTDITSRQFVAKELLVTNVHKFPEDVSLWEQLFAMDGVDIVIVDEAHHFPAGFWERIVTVAEASFKKVLFLTASPFRHDGQFALPGVAPAAGLRPFYHFTIAQAQQRGVIRNLEFREVQDAQMPANADAQQVEDSRFLAILQSVHACLVTKDTNLALPDGIKHHALIMVNSTPEASRMEKIAQLRVPGLHVRAYHGKPLKAQERRLRKAYFETNRQATCALIVVGMLREGYDYPPISVVAFGCKTESPVKMYQFFGRGLRRVPGEADVNCTVIALAAHGLRQLYQSCINERLVPEEQEAPEEDQDVDAADAEDAAGDGDGAEQDEDGAPMDDTLD